MSKKTNASAAATLNDADFGPSLRVGTHKWKDGRLAGTIVKIERVAGEYRGEAKIQTRVTLRQADGSEVKAYVGGASWADMFARYHGSIVLISRTGKGLGTRYNVQPHKTAKSLDKPVEITDTADEPRRVKRGATKGKRK